MGLDDHVVHRQPEARTEAQPPHPPVRAVEVTEEIRQRLGFGTGAVVPDIDLNHIGDLSRCDRDRATVGRQRARI